MTLQRSGCCVKSSVEGNIFFHFLEKYTPCRNKQKVIELFFKILVIFFLINYLFKNIGRSSCVLFESKLYLVDPK